MTRLLWDKIVVVTRSTALDELVRRFNTLGQARFYIEQSGGAFDTYQDTHTLYQRAMETLRAALPQGVRTQWIDRSFLPTFLFGPADLVVTLGPDGLVVNTAKYLTCQPLLAFNPDILRIDGVLLPFRVEEARKVFRELAENRLDQRLVAMAVARLNDGQELHAVNDLFIGQRTHLSARYTLRHGGKRETQSSSGIIVSTGAGSTGWFRSVLTGASAVAAAFAPSPEVDAVRDQFGFDWEARKLAYNVREPFISKTSSAKRVFGWITPENPLMIESHMPSGGVIFSDGVEEDFLAFESGAQATVTVADRTLTLLVPRTAS